MTQADQPLAQPNNDFDDPNDPGDIAPPPVDPNAKLGRLGPLLFQAHLGWSLTVGTVAAFLVPALVQQIAGADAGPNGAVAPNDKVALYGTLSIFVAFVGIIANIVFGALSDRTRTRWGRRNPWILIGGLAGSAVLSSASLVHDFWTLVLVTSLFSICFNAVVAPLFAVFPDRVPFARRGTASAIIGFVQVLTQSLGAIIGASFLGANLRVGVAVLPWLFAITCVIFFVFAKDRTTSPEKLPRFTFVTFLRLFKLPLKRDFLMLLFGRLLLNLAYNAVLFYQLYSLQDYVHLQLPQIMATIALAGTITAVGGGLGALIAGPISDKIKRRKPLFLIAAGLMSVALLPLVFSPSVFSFFAFMSVGSFAYGLYQSIDQAMMAGVLPTLGDHGRDLGFLNVAHSLPVFLVPIFASVALVVLNVGYPGLYVMCIICAVVAGGLVLAIRSVR